MEHVDLDLLGAEACESLAQHLDRTLNISLDHNLQLRDLALGDFVEEILKRDLSGGQEPLLTIALAAIAGDLEGLGLTLGCLQDVTGRRDIIEAGQLHRIGRSGILDPVAAVVGNSPHASPGGAAEEVVADLQLALLNQHRRDDAPTLFFLRLEDHAAGRALGGGLQLLHFGDQKDDVEEIVEALVLLRGNIHRGDIPAP